MNTKILVLVFILIASSIGVYFFMNKKTENMTQICGVKLCDKLDKKTIERIKNKKMSCKDKKKLINQLCAPTTKRIVMTKGYQQQNILSPLNKLQNAESIQKPSNKKGSSAFIPKSTLAMATI